MEQFYDLLPFNIKGFKLINRASLLEGNFTDKYIIGQTQDLNLDLHRGQFEKHYLIDAATSVVKDTPCCSFFITLIIFMFFLLQMILDPILIEIISTNLPPINLQITSYKGQARTSQDDQVLSNLQNESLGISFLIPLLLLRLFTWFLDITIRYIGLQYFRKKYIVWTLFLDFILICLTVIIAGFTTTLNTSLTPHNQQKVELVKQYHISKLFRDFIIFVLFIVGMIQARKALSVVKRLDLLFTQVERSCCNFQAF